jgi:hypothetical protein
MGKIFKYVERLSKSKFECFEINGEKYMFVSVKQEFNFGKFKLMIESEQRHWG